MSLKCGLLQPVIEHREPIEPIPSTAKLCVLRNDPTL